MSYEILFKKASPEEEAIALRAIQALGLSGKGRIPKWPFVSMEVGECVVISDERLGRADGACKGATRNKGFKFFKTKVPGGTLFKRIE